MRTLTTLLAVLLLASACAGGTDDPGGSGGPGGSDGPGDATTPVGDWVLDVADPPIAIPAGSRATLSIDEDGRAGGSTPCNSYGGTATWVDDGSFGLGEVAMTEMGCEPDRMTAQDEYLDALVATTTWTLDGPDALVLSGASSSLRYSRLAPVETAALVGTEWVLTGFLDRDAISSTASDVSSPRLRLDGDAEGGTFTMSSGCRDFAGEWLAAGDTITLPSWGQADGSRDVEDCSAAELESEALVLSVLESSFRATVDGETLELRSTTDDRLGLLLRVADPASGTGDDEEAREICESAIAMSEDGDGFPTREQALDSFIAGESGWWTPPGPGFGLDGTSITLDGEPVGEVYLFQFTNGTWAVSGYEVCYPADLAQG